MSQATHESPTRRGCFARYWWVMLLGLILVAGVGGMIHAGMKEAGIPIRGPFTPTLPLTVTWRPSAMGKGRVLIVSNPSDTHLHGVTITMRAPDGQKTSRIISTIAPHEEMEIGWIEMSPWVIEPGETATFSHPDFKAVDYLIP